MKIFKFKDYKLKIDKMNYYIGGTINKKLNKGVSLITNKFI